MVSRIVAKALCSPAFCTFLHTPPLVCAYIIVPIIIDTYVNLLQLCLQCCVCVWGVINSAGETKSSSFMLVVSEEIYVKQFV